nr:hypothetical protein [Micromonospora sp. DSM 115978]
MLLELLDRDLHRLVHERDYRPEGWTDAEIDRVRLVAQCSRAAKTPSDLYAMRLLGLRPRAGTASAVASAPLGAGRRLALIFKTDNVPMTAVLDVVSSRRKVAR